MDIGLWVMPSVENALAVHRALRSFGAPVEQISLADLQQEGVVFQIGVAPRRIDILTSATGLRFEEAYARSVPLDLDGIEARVLSVPDLITNKKATGRLKDLADVEALEALDG